MKIRPVELRDVGAIYAIQSACPELAQWPMADYARAARGEMAGWVAEENAEVTGFLVARRVGSDAEVLNFAVRAPSRRRGVGAGLLRESIAWAETFHAEKVFLEVRASNAGALRFYEHQGFQVVGRRPRYYANPPEDALVLSMTQV